LSIFPFFLFAFFQVLTLKTIPFSH